MKSLGPELEGIVRDESRKIEAAVYTWLMDDIEKSRKTWEAQGGENIRFSDADSKRFVDEVGMVTASVVAANPILKADYESFAAAAKRYRK